jgi:hypothetical protein
MRDAHRRLPTQCSIGYFVPNEEWQRYQDGKHKGISRYLIAQRGRTLSKEEFADFKRYVHSQQGSIADHTDLPSVFESRGHVPLGVTDEAEDSISFGAILKLSPREKKTGKADLLASINIVLQLKGESLSLYVFDSIKDLRDTERIKDIAKRWLRCVREQSK